MSSSKELPYGLPVSEVQFGATGDYWDGVRAAYEAHGYSLPALGAAAGGGAEIVADFASCEPPAFVGFPTVEIA